MNNEDYLGITALALSTLAERLAKSQDTEKVRPILMEELYSAVIRWQCDKAWGDGEAAKIKEKFVLEVRGSVDEVLKWRKRYEAKVAAGNN